MTKADDMPEESRQALMLDIRLASGRIVSLPYAWLSVADYLPEGKLLLDFGKYKVTAEGRNMLPVRESITEHRTRFIQEKTDAERGTKDEDALYFERIEITRAEDEL